MDRNEALNQLLHEKIERQAILKEKRNQLSNIDIGITGSKISRWFGTSFLRIKRLATILLATILIILSISLLLFPEILLLDKHIKTILVDQSKEHYVDIAGETLSITLFQLASDNSNFTVDEILSQVDKSFEKSVENEILSSIQFLGGLFLCLALVFLYIGRLTKKVRIRNSKISEAESVTQEIIKNFKTQIIQGDKEIKILKEIIENQNKSHQQSTPPKP